MSSVDGTFLSGAYQHPYQYCRLRVDYLWRPHPHHSTLTPAPNALSDRWDLAKYRGSSGVSIRISESTGHVITLYNLDRNTDNTHVCRHGNWHLLAGISAQ